MYAVFLHTSGIFRTLQMCTPVETVRSMLIDSKLPQKFWAEALSTAVYLRSRSPAKADNTWTSQKPTVGHLRMFGSDAYAYIPREERKKLDFKARKLSAFLLGMEMKRRDTVFTIQHEKKSFSAGTWCLMRQTML